ncbi:hypothetical protein R3P38DRAFT_1650832 [Favolaschia claudopus]|uniref:Uncharacterized protein n=1 Tax=Favolaschia claudopus TaxID=2862362 RepID=A0AAW0DNX4_9AGAR
MVIMKPPKTGIGRWIVDKTRIVNSLEPQKINSRDWLQLDYAGKLTLSFPARFIPHTGGTRSPRVDFRDISNHVRNGLVNEQLCGFLYFYTPNGDPCRVLAGGVRFRCTNHSSPSSFNTGVDLEDRMGLPWTLAFTRLIVRKQYDMFIHQLILDGFLTPNETKYARRLLAHNPDKSDHFAPPFVHEIGQPFEADFSRPLSISTLGPNGVVTSVIYPAIAIRGGAIARLERNKDEPDREELLIRIVKAIPDYHDRREHKRYIPPQFPDPVCEDFLPDFKHLSGIRSGDYLMHPAPTRGEIRPYVIRYTTDDTNPSRDSLLHCLLNPYQHFPLAERNEWWKLKRPAPNEERVPPSRYGVTQTAPPVATSSSSAPTMKWGLSPPPGSTSPASDEQMWGLSPSSKSPIPRAAPSSESSSSPGIGRSAASSR